MKQLEDEQKQVHLRSSRGISLAQAGDGARICACKERKHCMQRGGQSVGTKLVC
jgi:hypothetical protein